MLSGIYENYGQDEVRSSKSFKEVDFGKVSRHFFPRDRNERETICMKIIFEHRRPIVQNSVSTMMYYTINYGN